MSENGKNTDTVRDRLRDVASEAGALVFMGALRGAAAVMNRWGDYCDMRLLNKGFIGGVAGLEEDRKLGLAAERSKAFKDLHSALGSRFSDVEKWQLGAKIVQPEVPDIDDDRPDFGRPLRCTRFDGEYGSFICSTPAQVIPARFTSYKDIRMKNTGLLFRLKI